MASEVMGEEPSTSWRGSVIASVIGCTQQVAGYNI